MEIMNERCFRIAVHKSKLSDCLLIGKPEGKAQKTIKAFSTMTSELLELENWLKAEECTHVALEG